MRIGFSGVGAMRRLPLPLLTVQLATAFSLLGASRSLAEEGRPAGANAAAEQVAKEWPIAEDGPASELIRKVGAGLARGAPATSFPWHFVTIRDHAAKAFTVGGGWVYVSDGAIVVCAKEAELAAIMAHEMGHQLAGHFDARDHAKESATYPIGSLLHEVDAAKEIEADRLSLGILRSAGYDPQAALGIAQRVQNGGDGSPVGVSAARLKALRHSLREYSSDGRLDTLEYQDLRRQLNSR